VNLMLVDWNIKTGEMDVIIRAEAADDLLWK
jgi:hypothetical protein